MDDHYQTLGVSKSATQEEIKSAYRKLASKHHPDRGGDTAAFQQIQAAYEILGDAQKRADYDTPRSEFQQFGGMPPGFDEMFRGFSGFGDIFGQSRPRSKQNRTLNLQTSITLEEAYTGKELIATIKLPSGKDQIINVKIPAGVHDGSALILKGLGDDTIKNLPQGDIHLSISVIPDPVFERQNDDLIKELEISVFDAILGTEIDIITIDRKTLRVTISPGTQPGKILGAQGYGMPNLHNSTKGRLLLKIKVMIPTLLTDEQKELINKART